MKRWLSFILALLCLLLTGCENVSQPSDEVLSETLKTSESAIGESISTESVNAEDTEPPLILAYTEGLIFTLQGDEYHVSGYEGDATHVVIPDLYEGLPVVVIESYAFQDQDTLVHITIPKSVEEIRKNAFVGCDNLHEAVFLNFEKWTYINDRSAVIGQPPTRTNIPSIKLSNRFVAARFLREEFCACHWAVLWRRVS